MNKPRKPQASVPAKRQGRSPAYVKNQGASAKSQVAPKSPKLANNPDPNRSRVQTKRTAARFNVPGTFNQVQSQLAGITRRSLALLAFTLIALMALVPTVNSYVQQQQQLQKLQAQVADKKAEISALEQDIARWNDPSFVAAQARDRLLFAMPGETQYRLTDSSGQMLSLSEAEQAEIEAAKTSWFGMMWDSLVASSNAVSPEEASDEPIEQAPLAPPEEEQNSEDE